MTGKRGEYERADAAYHYISLEPQPRSPKKKNQALLHKDASVRNGSFLLSHVENA